MSRCPCRPEQPAVRHGSRVVELTGAVKEKAFIRELQWDVYGLEILHVDFARVSEHERIHLRVKVELRGQAPGTKAGGVIEHLLHELEIECEALKIPEKIEVQIGELELDGAIHAGEVKLPPGVELLTDPEQLVVQCTLPMAEQEAAGPRRVPPSRKSSVARPRTKRRARSKRLAGWPLAGWGVWSVVVGRRLKRYETRRRVGQPGTQI